MPPGIAESDKTLEPSVEIWTAIDPGLEGMLVRLINAARPSVKTSEELESVTEGEPDASLFHPPAGYRIVNRPAQTQSCTTGVQVPESYAPSPAPPPAE